MTLDDDNSIYVGGLSYDVTEDSLRNYFHIFGQIVATKIVNDRGVGGKCYGFVTFTNPRSATNAIDEMDGTTFNGRVIRVNEVRTRGGRPDFRENFRRSGRDADWDREKERDFSRDRDHYRDRNTDRPRDHDRGRERESERGHYSDQARDHAFDRVREVESHDHEHIKDLDQNSGRDNDMDSVRDKDMDKSKDRDGGRVYNKEQLSRNKLDDRLVDRRSRELSSASSDGYHEMEEEVARSNREREELQKELDRIEEMVEEKKQLVSNLRKKSQKLEDSLADAKKRSSQRHIMLKKLHKCFLQARDYAGKLKSSEQELELLVDTTMEEVEVDAAEDANTGNDSLYTNGQI